MPTPIVASYDPFDQDPAPVALALAAGTLTGAPVEAIAVLPPALVAGWDDPERDSPARALIAEALERLRHDYAVETRMVGGVSVPRALHELAAEEGAGLVVVGSTARGPVGRVLPGSTAERLLHGSPCAVALAPRGYRRAPIETIAVGFVDTPEGHAALVAAHRLAARMGARLRAVTAVHPSGALDAVAAQGTPPQRAVTLEGHHREELEAALRDALDALAPGVAIESEVHVDDPAEVLLRISEHVDLMVSGSRGYGPLRSVLLGGVSRRLVDGAHCPVLVLPRGVEHPLGPWLDVSGTAAAA